MDLAFFNRAEALLARDHAAPAIDFGVLVATLAAHQSASATARAAASLRGRRWVRPNDTLAELLAAGPAWRPAARAQRGSFNPRAALAAVNQA